MHGQLWRRRQIHQLKWAHLIRLGLFARYLVLRVLGHFKDRGVLIDLIQLLVELVLPLLTFNHPPCLAELANGASSPKRLNAALIEHLALTWCVEGLVESGMLLGQFRGVVKPGKVQVGAWLMPLVILLLH